MQKISVREHNLNRIITNVHAKYYSDYKIPKITAVWAVPSGILTRGLIEPDVGSLDEKLLDKCQDKICNSSLDYTLESTLRALSGNNYSRAHCLLATLLEQLKRNNRDTTEASVLREKYNEASLKTGSTVAAASVNIKTNIIQVHPCLNNKGTPPYVLNYLIFHELNHLLNEESTSHDEAFMAVDKLFLYRTSALKWLKKNGFPIVA